MAKDYTRQENLQIIEREARERGIPRDDFLRFAYIETGGRFDEQASRGPNGAKGLFQFVPGTARQYGIAGRELDPVANTDAAARLYLDNQRALVSTHQRDGRAYLSGKPAPDGLDMYLAHQQGAGGYRSVQAALATGSFSRGDTRSNLLNNISPRDVQAVTGRDMADVRGMSDRQLAATFVQYWSVKFDRVRIPEMGIEPVTSGRTPQEPAPRTTTAPAPTTPGQVQLDSPYEFTRRYDHLQYQFGSKSVNARGIDCSGWVGTLVNNAMDEVNREAGRAVFSRADRVNLGGENSEAIIDRFARSSGQLLTGSQVNRANLREGMIIGEDNGRQGWDNGRARGIDHITMVVRNPSNGELMISQSRGGAGVELTPIDRYLAAKQANGVRLFATDPLAEARPLLQAQAAERNPERPPASTQQTSASMRDGVINRQDSGAEVIRVQQMLNTLGYTGANGQPFEARTGSYGPNTEFAVKNFQQAHGLGQTGVVDRATLAALTQAQNRPLITEANHPQRALYEGIARQLPAGTRPEAIANVTLQAMENGISDRARLGNVSVNGSDVFVAPAGSFGGDWIKVDLRAPTASLRAMSDHMTQQAQEPRVQPQQQVTTTRDQQAPQY